MTFSRGPVSTVLICGVANGWRSKEAPRDVRGDERPAAAARSEEAGRARRGIERANTILNYFQLRTEIGRIEVKSGVVRLLLVVPRYSFDSRAQRGNFWDEVRSGTENSQNE